MRYGEITRARMFVQEEEDQIDNCTKGLSGETGEIAEYYKKKWYHPPSPRNPTREDLREEIGDVLWYLATLAEIEFGVSLRQIARENIGKLKARYPERYGDVDADAMVL